jgi:hypothetical protein
MADFCQFLDLFLTRFGLKRQIDPFLGHGFTTQAPQPADRAPARLQINSPRHFEARSTAVVILQGINSRSHFAGNQQRSPFSRESIAALIFPQINSCRHFGGKI